MNNQKEKYLKLFSGYSECTECTKGIGEDEYTDLEECDCCLNTGYITPEWFLSGLSETVFLTTSNVEYLGAILFLSKESNDTSALKVVDGRYNLRLYVEGELSCLEEPSQSEFLSHLNHCLSENFLSEKTTK